MKKEVLETNILKKVCVFQDMMIKNIVIREYTTYFLQKFLDKSHYIKGCPQSYYILEHEYLKLTFHNERVSFLNQSSSKVPLKTEGVPKGFKGLNKGDLCLRKSPQQQKGSFKTHFLEVWALKGTDFYGKGPQQEKGP